MTATIRPTSQGRPIHADSTVVVVDESSDGDVDSLIDAIGDETGAVTILVTTHPPLPCVVGFGAGIDAAVMWSDCRREQEAGHEATDRRVAAIRDRLTSRFGVPVERFDCPPTTRLFRHLRRREVDGVVRDLRRLSPARVVVDEAHHLCAELRAAIASER